MALAAIQGLNAKLQERDSEIAQLKADDAEIRAQVAELVVAMKRAAVSSP